MQKPTFTDWFTDTNTTDSKSSDQLSEKLYYNLTKSDTFNLDDLKINPDDFKLPDGLLDNIINYKVSATLEEVTTKDPDGTGAFDTFMTAISKHLEREFSQGRIVGADYSNAYIAAMQMALQQAVDFVLKKDQVYINTTTAKLTAIDAAMGIIKSKVALVTAQVQAYIAKTQYAGEKLKLSNLHEQYINLIAQYDNLLATHDNLVAQHAQILAQTEHINAQIKETNEKTNVQKAQTSGTRTDNASVAGSIGAQIQMVNEQIKLVREQVESARAQTLDTRTDGATVKGQIGKQKDVASQQIIAFKQKAGIDAANIASNAWITSKGMNDAVEAPTSMQNAALNNVVDQVYANAGLPTTGNHKNNLNGSVPG